MAVEGAGGAEAEQSAPRPSNDLRIFDPTLRTDPVRPSGVCATATRESESRPTALRGRRGGLLQQRVAQLSGASARDQPGALERLLVLRAPRHSDRGRLSQPVRRLA